MESLVMIKARQMVEVAKATGSKGRKQYCGLEGPEGLAGSDLVWQNVQN